MRGHRTIKLLMQPLANGGENAVIVPVDICQFGAPSRKRTDLITDCGEVVETLTRKEEDGSRTPMYLCKGVSSSHKHIGSRAGRDNRRRSAMGSSAPSLWRSIGNPNTERPCSEVGGRLLHRQLQQCGGA